jgi:hypothetical protein
MPVAVTLAMPVAGSDTTEVAIPVVTPAATTAAMPVAITLAMMPVAASDTTEVAIPVVTPATKSLGSASSLASTTSNLPANDVLTTNTIILPYSPLEFNQVLEPLSVTSSLMQPLGNLSLQPVTTSVSPLAEIKRQTQRQGNAVLDKALFHDVFLGQTTARNDLETEMNWDKVDWINDITQTIVNDHISRKTKPAKRALDAVLSTY